MPETLIGPSAALAGALVAVGVLWRVLQQVYRERIDDLKAQRDGAITREETAVAGWREQTAANAALAHTWAERNRLDGERRRRTDGR